MQSTDFNLSVVYSESEYIYVSEQHNEARLQ